MQNKKADYLRRKNVQESKNQTGTNTVDPDKVDLHVNLRVVLDQKSHQDLHNRS